MYSPQPIESEPPTSPATFKVAAQDIQLITPNCCTALAAVSCAEAQQMLELKRKSTGVGNASMEALISHALN
jgi:hypothetical protein